MFIIFLLIQLGIWLTVITISMVEHYSKRTLAKNPAAATTMNAVGFISRIVIWSVIALVALDSLGINVTTVVAGLGIGGLLGRENAIYPVVGEGSHAGFASETRMQSKVLKTLRQRFERVSEERLVSGPGLENIYWALCKVHGEQATEITAAEIFSRVLANEDVIATEATQLFFEVLGQIAGNLALALGAYDGVYLAGGILKRYPDLLKTSSFRSGFENKGRHRPLMEKIPTSLILHPQPGLLGASFCARELFGQTAIEGSK